MAVQKFLGDPLTVTIGQQATVELPPRTLRVRLTGLLFESDKTFLLPVAMKGIRGLIDYYNAHPHMSLVVTGHTDRIGDTEYNRALSDERAQQVGHFLKDEVDPWLQCYAGSPHSKPWGTREDQYMLSAVKDEAHQSFYDGPVHGRLDAATIDAVKRYQTARGLASDGQPGPLTRRPLITDYMQLDGTTLPAGADMKTLGCGENHNEVATADNTDEPANRRVEIFLFDGAPKPPCPASCPGDGCAYPEWKKGAQETVDFDHDLCELVVQCIRDDDKDPSPIVEAEVTLSREGQSAHQGVTDDDGQVWFRNLVPGTYLARGKKAGYQTGQATVEARASNLTTYQEVKSLDGDATPRDGHTTPSGGAVKMKPDPIYIQLDDTPAASAVLNKGRWGNAWLDVEFADGKGAGGYADADGKIVIERPSQPEGKVGRMEMSAHNPDPDAKGRVAMGVEGKWDIHTPDLTVKSSEVPNHLEVSTRLRLSMYVGRHLMTANVFDPTLLWGKSDSGFSGLIDDISLIRTVENTESGDSVRYAATSLDPKVLDQYFSDLIAACHAKDIQVLAGVAMSGQLTLEKGKEVPSDNPTKRGNFRDIINDPTRRATFAQNLVNFFYKEHHLPFDGISFDLEIKELSGTTSAAVTDFYAKLYDALLAGSTATNPILAVICAPYVAVLNDMLYVPAHPKDPKKPDDETRFVQVGSELQTHRFDIAKNRPNVIIRLMEDGPKTSSGGSMSPANVKAWHEEAIAYAIGDGGLNPSQVQLALAVGPNFDGGEITIEGFEDRCKNLARTNHIGMAVFAYPTANPHPITPWLFYQRYNAALNPNGPKPHQPVPSVTVNRGVTVRRGYPLQVPNDKKLG